MQNTSNGEARPGDADTVNADNSTPRRASRTRENIEDETAFPETPSSAARSYGSVTDDAETPRSTQSWQVSEVNSPEFEVVRKLWEQGTFDGKTSAQVDEVLNETAEKRNLDAKKMREVLNEQTPFDDFAQSSPTASTK